MTTQSQDNGQMTAEGTAPRVELFGIPTGRPLGDFPINQQQTMAEKPTIALLDAATKSGNSEDESGVERRRSPRFPASDLAEIRWTESETEVSTCPVTIVNVSARGMAVVARKPVGITAGATVTILTEQNTAVGHVRYVKETGRSQWLGIEVRDVKPR